MDVELIKTKLVTETHNKTILQQTYPYSESVYGLEREEKDCQSCQASTKFETWT